MSTVIPVPRSIDADELSDLDEDRAADEIVRRMEASFPGETFRAVAGGEASGEWNRLVRANGFSVPTPAMLDALQHVIESVLCDDDSFYG